MLIDMTGNFVQRIKFRYLFYLEKKIKYFPGIPVHGYQLL
jgi:hypothetical protein